MPDQDDIAAQWNAETGTFTPPARTVTVSPAVLSERISQGLADAGISGRDQAGVIDILGNAAVYLHGADAFDRQPATIEGIANEWSSLGLTETEADFMIDRSVAHHIERSQEREAEFARSEVDNEALIAASQLREPEYDTSNDYAEAYADVAGDPTLSGRLEEESPIDILADVQREAMGGQYWENHDLDREDDMEL